MGKKVDLYRALEDKSSKRKRHPNNRVSNPSNLTKSTSSTSTTNQQEGVNTSIGTRENYDLLNESNNNNDINSSERLIIKFPIKKIFPILTVLMPIFFILALSIFVVLTVSNEELNESGSGLATRGYYASPCDEVTVILVDRNNGYAEVGTKTLPLEEYVAGVVQAEVGGFNNIEVYKQFAIAARSFFYGNHNDCTIEGSDRRQAFTETDNPLILEAVEDTAGQVFLSDGKLVSVQYDAFACIAKDSNYYTISQANQRVPASWVDNHIPKNSYTQDWFICDGTLRGHHGNGMSQWGSYYLATEEGYNYLDLIEFYLKDLNITISTNAFMTDIDGIQLANLEIKDTSTATTLYERLDGYLESRGHTLDSINSFITDNVIENGWGTRSGVVTAAVSIINYLYDNFNIKLPYYWGGNYQKIGVNPNFGGPAPLSISSNGNPYNHAGFDCSGFVSWAIRNGGYNIDRKTTYGFDQAFSSDSCNITDASCVGRPGDLINSKTCHVQMIVAVDEESNSYYIAESSDGLVMRKWNMHQSNCGASETRIIHMDNFYNNSSNVDNRY